VRDAEMRSADGPEKPPAQVVLTCSSPSYTIGADRRVMHGSVWEAADWRGLRSHRLPRDRPAADEVPAALRELRRSLPAEVVVVAPTHPLVGRTLGVEGYRTVGGELRLLVRLPDGSPGSVAVSATSAGERPAGGGALLSPGGVRRLRALLDARRGDHDGA
jgi:hypothetical protein